MKKLLIFLTNINTFMISSIPLVSCFEKSTIVKTYKPETNFKRDGENDKYKFEWNEFTNSNYFRYSNSTKLLEEAKNYELEGYYSHYDKLKELSNNEICDWIFEKIKINRNVEMALKDLTNQMLKTEFELKNNFNDIEIKGKINDWMQIENYYNKMINQTEDLSLKKQYTNLGIENIKKYYNELKKKTYPLKEIITIQNSVTTLKKLKIF